MPARLSLILAGLLVWSGCVAGQPAVSSQPAPEVAGGHLFIVGGGPRPAELMSDFIELAGGPGRARIAVVPTASANPASAGESLVREMERYGAEAVSLDLSREQAEDPASVQLLDGITGVWFSGGVQTRHTAVFSGTPMERAFHRLYREGAVLGGTSAGAAIMSTVMITGGERRPGGDRPVENDAWITIDRDNVVTVEGFGFLPNAIVDQHFVRRKRHNRLLSLVLETPEKIGVGVDEGTALVVQPDGRWRVVGQSVVVLYDARAASVTTPGTPVLGTAGVRMHLLPAGSVFEPTTGDAVLPGDEENILETAAWRDSPAEPRSLLRTDDDYRWASPRAPPVTRDFRDHHYLASSLYAFPAAPGQLNSSSVPRVARLPRPFSPFTPAGRQQ